mgnify:CR=1 FL=1
MKPVSAPKIGTRKNPSEIIDCAIPIALPCMWLGALREIKLNEELKETAPATAEKAYTAMKEKKVGMQAVRKSSVVVDQ